MSRFGHNFSVTFLSQINSKLHETFRITSLGSPEMIYNACVRACAHVHAQRVKSCTLLLCPFLGQFFKFLRRFLTENEKTEATLQIGIVKAHLFHFIHFFRFRYGSPSKWPKCVKNVKKKHFFGHLGRKVIK